MIYNVCLYFSPFVQKQYFDTYGDKEVSFLFFPLRFGTLVKEFSFLWFIILFINYLLFQMLPVAANDVAFSIHAVVMTSLTLFQICIYEVSNVFIF